MPITKEVAMYDMKNLTKFKKLGELAPEAFKAFVAFDEAAVKYGVIPVKYKELMAVAVALTTQCPYCIEIHSKKAKKAGARIDLDPTDLVTHGLIVGMTGSGKTGLAIALIEEVLRQGVPVLAIDPKGDLGNLLLLFDEIQCGLGRTGNWCGWKSLDSNIVPDGVSWAKGIANGFPLGAFWAASSRGLCDLLGPGTHGTTYGGNPVCCAAALKVLERHVLQERRFARPGNTIQPKNTLARGAIYPFRHPTEKIHSSFRKALSLVLLLFRFKGCLLQAMHPG
jgi:AhpD family alkylhydroperoxidase